MMPPLDFEKIMLIGFNENLYDYEEQEDKKYAKMLVEHRGPRIISAYQNPDPKKNQASSKAQ